MWVCICVNHLIMEVDSKAETFDIAVKYIKWKWARTHEVLVASAAVSNVSRECFTLENNDFIAVAFCQAISKLYRN